MQEYIEAAALFLKNSIPQELVVFIMSVLPVSELRGGLIAAYVLDMDLIKAFVISFIGNMLPIPFILLFIRKIFDWMRKWKHMGKVIAKMEIKAEKHRHTIEKYGIWGLLILVAVPLPGTGAWTGALVAAIMDLRILRALPVIAVGVLIAGMIVSLVTYGLIG